MCHRYDDVLFMLMPAESSRPPLSLRIVFIVLSRRHLLLGGMFEEMYVMWSKCPVCLHNRTYILSCVRTLFLLALLMMVLGRAGAHNLLSFWCSCSKFLGLQKPETHSLFWKSNNVISFTSSSCGGITIIIITDAGDLICR